MTKFSQKVYQIVKKIPRGKVMSYTQVAKLASYPRAWRAVGNVLNKNRNKKIPCHRIVCLNGKVGGYHKGRKNKVSMLKKEGVEIPPSGRVKPSSFITSLPQQSF